MSSSRAMASAQQKRVTMQKSIAPANNSNPRRSIASRGRFNANPRKNQMLQQQQQQQMLQQQMLQQQQMIPQQQQQQQQMIPQQQQQQQQMIPQQNDQFMQMQNNFTNSNQNYDYNPMPFQSPSPVKSNKKIHVNQAVSLLSQKIANVERIMFGDNDNDMNFNFAKKNNNEIDNSVLTTIIERIEKLEKSVLMFDNLKELIESNTKAIEELQCEDDTTNEENDEDNADNEDIEENDEDNNVQTNTHNVNLIVEDVSDSEEDTYHSSNYFERNRLFVKPTF